MWSTSVGAEVMKPLATPVLGGMVSSLLHVLIVTPVIFFWLRERRLGLQHEATLPPPRPARRRIVVAGALAVVLVTTAWAWMRLASGRDGPAAQDVVATVPSGGMEVSLLAPGGALRQGRTVFTLEFRRSGEPALADVDDVRASATMSMPGMVMPGNLVLTPTEVDGRYRATAEFGMAGTWRFLVEWTTDDGPATVSFDGEVQ
jgi:Cu(I)/Ag(I) efflux system membrane protein CusA/SilA